MRMTSQWMPLGCALGCLVVAATLTFVVAVPRIGHSLEVAVDVCQDGTSATLKTPANSECTLASQNKATPVPPVLSSPSATPQAAGEETATTPVKSSEGAGLTLTPCPAAPPRTRGPTVGISTEIKRRNGNCGDAHTTGAVPIAGSVDFQPGGNDSNKAPVAEKEYYSWVEGYINDAYVWGEVRVTRVGQVDGYVYRNGDRIQVQGSLQPNDQIIATDAKGNYIALKLLPVP